MQWVLAGYALAFGLITGGRLDDIFWRKRMFLFGVASFRVRGRANRRATLRTCLPLEGLHSLLTGP